MLGCIILFSHDAEHENGENGDDHACFYTQDWTCWRENGHDNTCNHKEGDFFFMTWISFIFFSFPSMMLWNASIGLEMWCHVILFWFAKRNSLLAWNESFNSVLMEIAYWIQFPFMGLSFFLSYLFALFIDHNCYIWTICALQWSNIIICRHTDFLTILSFFNHNLIWLHIFEGERPR